jgi:hypothetical protein
MIMAYRNVPFCKRHTHSLLQVVGWYIAIKIPCLYLLQNCILRYAMIIPSYTLQTPRKGTTRKRLYTIITFGSVRLLSSSFSMSSASSSMSPWELARCMSRLLWRLWSVTVNSTGHNITLFRCRNDTSTNAEQIHRTQT